MDISQIERRVKIFSKFAQEIQQTNTDPVTPALENKGVTPPSDDLMNLFVQALQEAAEKNLISKGQQYNVGFKVGQGNKVIFSLDANNKPANPAITNIFTKYVAPYIQKALSGVNAVNFVKNQWTSWGWV
jgi:hypothetical protein